MSKHSVSHSKIRRFRKSIRDDRGKSISQTEFWEAIGVTQSTGSRYEMGENMPKTVQLLLKQKYDYDVREMEKEQ